MLRYSRTRYQICADEIPSRWHRPCSVFHIALSLNPSMLPSIYPHWLYMSIVLATLGQCSRREARASASRTLHSALLSKFVTFFRFSLSLSLPPLPHFFRRTGSRKIPSVSTAGDGELQAPCVSDAGSRVGILACLL